jgi:hypothetical protein
MLNTPLLPTPHPAPHLHSSKAACHVGAVCCKSGDLPYFPPFSLLHPDVFSTLLNGLCPQESKFCDLPYFLGLASMTIYIGAHRGLNNRQRQQISLKEGALAPVAASGGWGGRLRGVFSSFVLGSCSSPRLLHGPPLSSPLSLPAAAIPHPARPLPPACLPCLPACPAVSLFGLYLLLKYLPDLNIQTFLNAYFWLLGGISMIGAFAPTMRSLVRAEGSPGCGGVCCGLG